MARPRVYLDTRSTTRKARTPRPEVSTAMVEAGTSGLRIGGRGIGGSSWIIDDTRNLSYAQRISLYREMGRTPVFGAGMFIFRMLLSSITYEVKPRGNSSNPTLKLRAEFVKDVLADMATQLPRTDWDAWSCIQYGLSPFEVIYKRRSGDSPGTWVDAAGFTRSLPGSRWNDGLVGIDRLAYRAPGTVERWLLDEHMGVHGLVQRDPNTGADRTIPAWKVLRHTFGSGSHPLGESAFDPCAGIYSVWKRLVESEAIGATRRLAGTPVGTCPPDWLEPVRAGDPASVQASKASGAASAAALKLLLQNWQTDPHAALLLPAIFDKDKNKLLDLRLIGMEGTSGVDTNAIITRHELRMGSALLASMIFLGQSRGGTQALAAEQSALLRNCLNSLADERAAAISEQVFRTLMRLNGWPESEAPELIPQRLAEVPTFAELSAGIAQMAAAGLVGAPDSVLAGEWRARGGIEPAAPGEGEADLEDDELKPADPIGERPPGGLPPVGAA